MCLFPGYIQKRNQLERQYEQQYVPKNRRVAHRGPGAIHCF